MILGTALRSAGGVGTNLKGPVTHTSWLFLLPHLERRVAVAVGCPDLALLRAVSAIADTTVVVEPERAARERAMATVAALGTDAVIEVAPAPPTGAVVDLALRVRHSRMHDQCWAALSNDRLARDAVVFDALGTAASSSGAALVPARVPADHEIGAVLDLCLPWVAPPSGALRANLLRGKRVAMRVVRKVLAIAGRLRAVAPDRASTLSIGPARARSRRGPLLRFPEPLHAMKVPSYIFDLAEEAGVDLAGARWTMAAEADYRSQKLVYFIHLREGSDLVVKVSRDPEFSARLENEYEALRLLADSGVGHAEEIPRPRFAGKHRTLFVLGQTAMEGAPLTVEAGGDAGSPLIARAIDTVIALGTHPAFAREERGDAVATAVSSITERYIETYGPSAQVCARLTRDLEAVRAARTVPIGFQHGDAGVWNMLAAPSGRIALLDWENADPEGLLLWDIGYLVQTYGWRAASQRGARYTPSVFREQLLDPSPWRDLLDRAVSGACAASGTPPEVSAPMFRLGLVHQAVKEATRLEPQTLQRGLYTRLLESAATAAERA